MTFKDLIGLDELAVLGCLLSDTEAITEAMTAGLCAEDFSTLALRWIFNAVQEIYNCGSMAAVGDVVDILRKRGQLESADGEKYIKSIPGFACKKKDLGYFIWYVKGCPPTENENFTSISDKEFEQAVLGCLLSDTEAITEAMTLGLCAEDFSVPALRLIFNAVQEIYDSGYLAAVGDVVDILRKRGQLESAGGEESINSIPGFAGVKTNLDYYIRTLKECPPV